MPDKYTDRKSARYPLTNKCCISMGGARIFYWGGPRIDEAQDAGQNVAIFALNLGRLGGGHGPVVFMTLF